MFTLLKNLTGAMKYWKFVKKIDLGKMGGILSNVFSGLGMIMTGIYSFVCMLLSFDEERKKHKTKHKKGSQQSSHSSSEASYTADSEDESSKNHRSEYSSSESSASHSRSGSSSGSSSGKSRFCDAKSTASAESSSKSSAKSTVGADDESKSTSSKPKKYSEYSRSGSRSGTESDDGDELSSSVKARSHSPKSHARKESKEKVANPQQLGEQNSGFGVASMLDSFSLILKGLKKSGVTSNAEALSLMSDASKVAKKASKAAHVVEDNVSQAYQVASDATLFAKEKATPMTTKAKSIYQQAYDAVGNAFFGI